MQKTVACGPKGNGKVQRRPCLLSSYPRVARVREANERLLSICVSVALQVGAGEAGARLDRAVSGWKTTPRRGRGDVIAGGWFDGAGSARRQTADSECSRFQPISGIVLPVDYHLL